MIRLDFYMYISYSVSQIKTLLLGFLAITSLWKRLEIKVGGVSKNFKKFSM